MENIEQWWAARFGDTPPVGYCLRQAFDSRWLRVHSLPESKRYAESAAEHDEVLRRAWVCACELLPEGEAVWIVSCEFAESIAEPRLAEAPSLVFRYLRTFESEHADLPLRAYVAAARWPHEDFDALISAIAADRIRALWVSAATGAVFAPYDGGIDLILESTPRRDALRGTYGAWLSNHPAGL